MPPIVLSIIALINLVSTTGPELAKLYQQARSLFDMLFRGGLITVAQQAALKSWADAHEAATLAGRTPPEWQIEPDPPTPIGPGN